MPRPPGLPKLTTIGARVRWWRKHRGMGPKDLAVLIPCSTTALTDLELGRTHKGTFLGKIAAALNLNIHYLESDEGEPEAEFPQDPPAMKEPWPLKSVSPEQLRGLDRIELGYAESKLNEALSEIESERRSKRKAR